MAPEQASGDRSEFSNPSLYERLGHDLGNSSQIARLHLQAPGGIKRDANVIPIPGAVAVAVTIRIAPEAWHLYVFPGEFDLSSPADIERLTADITRQERVPYYRPPVTDNEVNAQLGIMIQTAQVLHPQSAVQTQIT